ncbi:MAG: response regulator transcription factor [Gammaproteobacteria bacterium]|nr:response regulator transcription factor [Gammaproteobacteria bacterium]MCP5198441.1 response regulator transcription factor [Gammaproteobacteria bacterium]
MTATASAPRCLIIDDDQAFREVLAAALTRRGYAVTTAADGTSALVAARATPPAYVVLDLRLEQDSGLQLIEPLRAIDPALRIVVLTGFASIATAVHAIKLGAVQYLTKPADADEIIAAFGAPGPDPQAAVPSEPTSLQHLEWEHIQKTLIACKGNVSDAARKLGLHRRTLQRKLQKRPAGL